MVKKKNKREKKKQGRHYFNENEIGKKKQHKEHGKRADKYVNNGT
jgi:hypothetical protein